MQLAHCGPCNYTETTISQADLVMEFLLRTAKKLDKLQPQNVFDIY